MHYKIIHTTTYTYYQPVSLCHNIARLAPRSVDNQICTSSTITITLRPEVINEYQDFFGNKVMYFAVQQEHIKLSVTVISEIEKTSNALTSTATTNSISWENIRDKYMDTQENDWETRQYILETNMTGFSPEIQQYAQISFTPGRSMYDASLDLMQRIYKDFEFKPGFTTVATALSVVMKARKGVCQDFAHLAIACVRSMGLPARYISGYLETLPPPGKEKLTGVDATHAWFAVFIPGTGWVDFDPTNNQTPNLQYITACWGRDYNDIAPLKGVIINSGPHELSVSVDVRRSI